MSHPMTRPPSWRRAASAAALPVALLAATALALALTARLRGVLPLDTDTTHVDGYVEVGVVAIGIALSLWLAWGLAFATACAAVRAAGHTWRAGEHAVARYAPALVRRVLVVAIGAGMSVSVVAGANAAAPAGDLDVGWVVTAPATPAPADVDAAAPDVPAPDPTTAPDTAPPAAAAADTPAPAALLSAPPAVTTAEPVAARPTTPNDPAPTARTEGTPDAATVEVGPGDSLWRIAARALPAGATDAEIAAEWPRWYAANAAVIGPDPGVLHPGQVLRAPGPTTSTTSEGTR